MYLSLIRSVLYQRFHCIPFRENPRRTKGGTLILQSTSFEVALGGVKI